MLAKITFGLFFLLLIWGNLVAGLKAGLACPDWPLCHGKILPPFRWDIYMEFGHRVIAAFASLFLVILCYKRLKSYSGKAKAVPILAVALLLAEIVMGGLVVLLELPVNLTTIHFMAALVIFLMVFYMMIFDGVVKPTVFSFRGYSALFFVLLALVFLQAVLGAYVRHMNAGLACPDFPTCLNKWIPMNLYGKVLAHYSHRIFAYLIFFSFAALYVSTSVDERLKNSRGLALALFVLVLAQIGVGALVVLSQLHFMSAALHLAVALTMLSILTYMWTREMQPREAIL